MRRCVAITTLCALFSLSAFAVLLAGDRQLGLPLPYSIPLAFTVVSVMAPLVFAVANAVRMRRPILIKPIPVVERRAAPGLPDARAVHRPAEGVVLLDFSSAKTLQGRAA